MSLPENIGPDVWPQLRPIEVPKRLVIYAAMGQALEAYHVEFMPHVLGGCDECTTQGKCGEVEFNLRVANSLAEYALQDPEVRQAIKFAKMRTAVISAAWDKVLELRKTGLAPTVAEVKLTDAFSQLIAAGGLDKPGGGGAG